MIKFYEKSTYILLLLFIFLFPILPSYGVFSTDILVYTLLLLQIIGFIFISEERKNLILNLKNIILKDRIFITLILLNILMYLSMFRAFNKYVTLTNSIRFSMYLFIFYIISYKLKKSSINNVIIVFLSSSIVISLITIFQVISTKIMGNNVDMDHRIASTLENPNNLGAYSIIVLFIFINYLIKVKNKKMKIISSIATLLLLFNIIVSQSRNALLALILGIFIFAILYNKRFLLYSIFVPIILFIIPQTRGRLFAVLDMTQNDSRLKIWKLTEIMINNKNRLFGLGYENYSINYKSYLDSNPSYFVRESLLPLHPHNAILKFQVELGVFGTILFILFIIFSLWSFYKLAKYKVNNNSIDLSLGLFVSFISFQAMNIIDCYYGPIKIMYSFFIILGILNSNLLKSKHI
ncbi:MAG: O-antigen ligase family protein [Clostridium sp.]|uniref:O-antigen ligase family protein n=1 Tax=Clostridium sp. TaxID=1506 RepID=UPI0025C70762|nr:O-antigen ligase family protein [Clostridium sp.]MCF0147254.1 O-antigen ligase family protein [Clostridium sp.]